MLHYLIYIFLYFRNKPSVRIFFSLTVCVCIRSVNFKFTISMHNDRFWIIQIIICYLYTWIYTLCKLKYIQKYTIYERYQYVRGDVHNSRYASELNYVNTRRFSLPRVWYSTDRQQCFLIRFTVSAMHIRATFTNASRAAIPFNGTSISRRRPVRTDWSSRLCHPSYRQVLQVSCRMCFT